MFKKLLTPALVLASLLSLGGCHRESPNPTPARPQAEAGAGAPQPQSCADHFVDGQAPRITNPKLDKATEALCFNVFSVLHSGITRTPLWSAEHLQAQNILAAQELSRENSFHPEPRLPSGQRAELADYARSGYDRRSELEQLVKKGLRAQLRVANLLTGQQYVALDFFPHAAPVKFDKTAEPVELPTVPGNFDRLQQQLGNIVDKLGSVQFGAIGSDLQGLLKSLTRLSNRLNSQVAPQATATLKAAQRSLGHVDSLMAPDSALTGNLDQTLRELRAAAKSLRALADYLQAHPSSMLRGNPADVLPGQ